MADPGELRQWAASMRGWAARATNQDMAGQMRNLAEELEKLASAKETARKPDRGDPDPG